MILGRPTNLWLGLITAMAGLITSALVAAGVDPTLVASLVGPAVTVLGALIVLIANQAPTINPGDTVTMTTPKGYPNQSIVVNPPDATPIEEVEGTPAATG
jgi:hypothetical protein